MRALVLVAGGAMLAMPAYAGAPDQWKSRADKLTRCAANAEMINQIMEKGNFHADLEKRLNALQNSKNAKSVFLLLAEKASSPAYAKKQYQYSVEQYKKWVAEDQGRAAHDIAQDGTVCLNFLNHKERTAATTDQ